MHGSLLHARAQKYCLLRALEATIAASSLKHLGVMRMMMRVTLPRAIVPTEERNQKKPGHSGHSITGLTVLSMYYLWERFGEFFVKQLTSILGLVLFEDIAFLKQGDPEWCQNTFKNFSVFLIVYCVHDNILSIFLNYNIRVWR